MGVILNIMEMKWDKNKSLDEIARVAVEGEREAIALYTRAYNLCDRPRSKLLYRELARMEREHLAVLAARFHMDVQPPTEEEINRLGDECGADEGAILKRAVEEEKRAAELYQRGFDAATSKKAKSLFEQLVADEEYHRDLLTNLYAQLFGKPLDM